jgi:hypothetical protein
MSGADLSAATSGKPHLKCQPSSRIGKPAIRNDRIEETSQHAKPGPRLDPCPTGASNSLRRPLGAR